MGREGLLMGILSMPLVQAGLLDSGAKLGLLKQFFGLSC